MKKHITAILLLLACTILSAQENGVKVKVTDEEGMPVAGAVISVKGNPAPVLTDKKGEATVYAMIGDNLTVTLFNRYYSETTVDSENMDIQFSRNDLLLDIGYDRKVSKKYSSMSIDGAGSSDIEVARDRSVLNSVNGLIPGLYVSPAYNVPWFPTPNVYVRGKGSYNGNGVKYFIDGIERDPSLVNSEEVESVTVLKDAAALAIYGVRGADGIVLITTKRGSDGAMRIKTDYNFAVATPYDMPRMASAADYAAAVNEALANDGLAPRYSMNDINALRNGTSKYIPDVDWQKEMLRSTAFTHDFNISLDGAEKRMRYYVYGNFNSYRGLLNNTESNEGYSTQLQMSNLRLRTNLEADVTKTTKLRLNMMGDLNQYQEPASGYYLSGIYDTPAAAFPAKAEDGTWIRSTMFANPLATLTASGYNVYLQRSLYADISIDQDMSAITEGLSLQIKANYDNSANIKDSHTRSYAYYNLNYQYDAAGNVTGTTLDKYGNETGLSFGSSLQSGSYVYTRFSASAKLTYDRSFGDHGVRADAIWSLTRKKTRGQNNIFPYMDYILRVGYDYRKKYIIDLVADYAGSAYLMEGDKYRLYPALSAAWIISSEDWMKGADAVDYLKLRASYGISGYDGRIGYGLDKASAGSGYQFVTMVGSSQGGLALNSYASTYIEPETDYKADVALEMTLFKNLDIQIEGFYNNRKNIKVSSSGVYSSLLGLTAPSIFTGETVNYGAELVIDWSRNIGDFYYHVGGTASYTMNKILEMGEEFHPYDYMYRTGNSIGTLVLYEDNGLYQKSDFDSEGNLLPGNPVSTLISTLRPGDVKYVDKNGDGKIDPYDKSYMPEYNSDPYLTYGINFGFRYRNFGMEAMFTGIEGRTVQLTISSVYWPLYGNNRNISEFYLADHWSESNPGGRYPRLTTLTNGNNFQGGSTIWLESGDFFKLKYLYLYYSLKNKKEKGVLDEVRIFVRGYNLFSFDSIKIFDPESITSGYPTTRALQAGVKFTF